jgi:hypothetical protein
MRKKWEKYHAQNAGQKRFTYFLMGRENVLNVNTNSHHIVYLSILREINGERSSDGSFWNRAVRTSHQGLGLNGKEF